MQGLVRELAAGEARANKGNTVVSSICEIRHVLRSSTGGHRLASSSQTVGISASPPRQRWITETANQLSEVGVVKRNDLQGAPDLLHYLEGQFAESPSFARSVSVNSLELAASLAVSGEGLAGLVEHDEGRNRTLVLDEETLEGKIRGQVVAEPVHAAANSMTPSLWAAWTTGGVGMSAHKMHER